MPQASTGALVTAGSQIAADLILSSHILNGEIVNADLSATAAIAYSKLNLALAIVNADIAAAAAIADTKLATIATAGKVDGAALTGFANIPSGAGNIPTANLGNQGYTSRARVYRATTGQVITANTVTKIQFNGESYDGDAEFDSVTNFRFTAIAAGRYLIAAQVRYSSTEADKVYEIFLDKNGVNIASNFLQSSVASNLTPKIIDIVTLAANDYLEISTRHNEATSGDIDAGESVTFLAIHRLS